MLTFDGPNFGKFDLIRWQTCILERESSTTSELLNFQ
jgi:hypothetical protein